MLKCWYVLRKRGTVVDFLGAFFAIFFGIKVFRAMQERIFLAVGQRILSLDQTNRLYLAMLSEWSGEWSLFTLLARAVLHKKKEQEESGNERSYW
ncbi:hypothetical protein TNIN_464911 [Trichonephila inaurata madagascariensis]|uniref:Uncharacterized protein n=1 Tax=Trichonephila inaurata madagascariensis TaxID=2747483 RepID=A0A8X6XYN6_9ARAC|nr:hypothetical protein TNIN_464911 [Trichonephila inaurata madagascariensis]